MHQPQRAALLLDAIIRTALEKQCSDIHFGANEKIALRINGFIMFIEEIGILSDANARDMIALMMACNGTGKELDALQEIDLSYTHDGRYTFRCNVFYRRGNISISMRHLSVAIPSPDSIGIPAKMKDLIEAQQGLILICGPTGHGKTTSAYALVEEINKTRKCHILTIEDPIEYRLSSKQCIVSQRQIGSDTHSFEQSLRSAMRQDPDVIMIGEMRDQETIRAVFNLSITGHLVISTIHATNASQTIYRIMQAFPLDQRGVILNQFADSLLGILNQRLVPGRNGHRTAIFELALGNYAVKNAIRNEDISQIENTIATSSHEGMLTLEHSIRQRIIQGLIDEYSALPYVNTVI